MRKQLFLKVKPEKMTIVLRLCDLLLIHTEVEGVTQAEGTLYSALSSAL